MYVHCFNALTGLSCYDSVEVENIEDLQFQCPHGLELLPDGSRQFIQAIKVSMPSQARVVTHRINQLCYRCMGFNALTGLSCYCCIAYHVKLLNRFNALTGLSCYSASCWLPDYRWEFQCPHRLELLRSMDDIWENTGLFQCPHRLELLPI